MMAEVDQWVLPEAWLKQSQLYAIVNAIRLQASTYKTSGSVHGCALFRGEDMLVFVEDVGRHNAVDTIAGWMWLQDPADMHGQDKAFYTTGRMTSEMVIKTAQMGHEVAGHMGLCTIGRATHTRFLSYTGCDRVVMDRALVPPLQGGRSLRRIPACEPSCCAWAAAAHIMSQPFLGASRRFHGFENGREAQARLAREGTWVRCR